MTNHRAGLHDAQRLTDRALVIQQRFFGSLSFGPLYVLATVTWVREAPHMGWDNAGLTIYTFIVSALAIYMSWVVTNLLNRSSAREAARDDLEAREVAVIYAQTIELLDLTRAMHGQLAASLEILSS